MTRPDRRCYRSGELFRRLEPQLQHRRDEGARSRARRRDAEAPVLVDHVLTTGHELPEGGADPLAAESCGVLPHVGDPARESIGLLDDRYDRGGIRLRLEDRHLARRLEDVSRYLPYEQGDHEYEHTPTDESPRRPARRLKTGAPSQP